MRYTIGLRRRILDVLLIISIIVEVVLGSVGAKVVVVRHAAVELSLKKEENLLDELNGVRSLEEVWVELVRRELLSLVVEISSILSLSLLLLADLGQLIVGNIELLSIDNCSVEALASFSCSIRLLEANEGASRGLIIVTWQDLDALNLTKLCKNGSQIILLEFSGKILDEEVAHPLRVLESLLLSEDHTLSLYSCQSRLHVELATIDILIVEFLDSSLSSKEASIMVLRVLEADEGKLALWVERVLLNED